MTCDNSNFIRIRIFSVMVYRPHPCSLTHTHLIHLTRGRTSFLAITATTTRPPHKRRIHQRGRQQHIVDDDHDDYDDEALLNCCSCCPYLNVRIINYAGGERLIDGRPLFDNGISRKNARYSNDNQNRFSISLSARCCCCCC